MFDFFAAPPITDDFSLGHLPEQMGTAAGGMFLFVGSAPTGAHDATFLAAALPHAYAAQSSVTQAAVILRELEMRFRFPWGIVRAESKILVQLVGLNQLAGIHLPVRIPGVFEFAESLHQFWPEHLRE